MMVGRQCCHPLSAWVQCPYCHTCRVCPGVFCVSVGDAYSAAMHLSHKYKHALKYKLELKHEHTVNCKHTFKNTLTVKYEHTVKKQGTVN